jgi:serine/threonine-protein kinase
VKVPYVKGETESTAKSDLEADGLVVSETTQQVTSASDDGVVLQVTPSGGTTVQQGSTVNLVIGQYSAGPTTTG